MKVEEESEKVGLKLNIQKTKIMASSPIISCQIDGETMQTVTDFIFLGSKITADSDCSHEIKKKKKTTFALWEENYDKVDSILKRSTGITLNTKVFIAKAMVLSSTHVWK